MSRRDDFPGRAAGGCCHVAVSRFSSKDASANGLATRSLLAEALCAFRDGRLAGRSAPPPNAAQSRYEKQILDRLSVPDRAALELLAPSRESALVHARGGRAVEARQAMTLARFTLSVARLSDTGREYARSLHRAAESYLYFRSGQYADAHERMVDAMTSTERMADVWGDIEAVVSRRIHLAHNLMRVEAASPALGDAGARGLALLGQIDALSRSTAGDAGSAAPPFDQSMLELHFDGVTETLAETLVGAASPVLQPALASLADSPVRSGRIWRGREWLAIKSVALEPATRPFLQAAVPFLRVGRGTAPTLWYAVAYDLLQVATRTCTSRARDAVGEIASELMEGRRIPTRIRLAAASAREDAGRMCP